MPSGCETENAAYLNADKRRLLWNNLNNSDCIRKTDDLDRDEAVSAIKAFMKRSDVSNQKLLDYSDVFHIRNQAWQYLEVLR